MRGGCSRVNITPQMAVPMGGYAARTSFSEGVHDPLFARALVLDDGTTRVALVGCDLVGMEPDRATRLRRRIEQVTNIAPSHVMLTCSHTHSGPLVAPRRVQPPPAQYLDWMEDKVVQAAREAAEKLAPVRLGAGQAKVYLGVNRRERTPEGGVKIGRNPEGYASPHVHILVMGNDHGVPQAVLFNYGAHPVVLSHENLEISGDYAGRAEQEVEENYGGRTTALFTLGFAGDVNVSCEERTFDEVETAGMALGRAVLETIKGIELAPGGSLGAHSRTVALPLAPPPSVPEAERGLYRERDALNRLLNQGRGEAEIARQRMIVEWASDRVALARRGPQEHTVDLEIQVLTMGDVALVGLSGEVFAEYAKFLDEISPFAQTVPVSMANGAVGYIPTAAAFENRGYEVEGAPRFYGVLEFEPQIEGIVRQALADALSDTAGVPVSPTPETEEQEPASA
jgi:hypothetical protein